MKALAFLLALLAGCAYVQVEPDGTRRVTGLVSMQIPPSTGGSSACGQLFRLTSIGVSYLSTPAETGFALCYQHYGFAAVQSDSCFVPVGSLR